MEGQEHVTEQVDDGSERGKVFSDESDRALEKFLAKQEQREQELEQAPEQAPEHVRGGDGKVFSYDSDRALEGFITGLAQWETEDEGTAVMNKVKENLMNFLGEQMQH